MNRSGKKTFVLGAGGLARELRALLRRVHPSLEVEAFVDRDAGNPIQGVPVISEAEFLAQADGADVLLGLGTSRHRERLVRTLDATGIRVTWPTLIHPTATIDDESSVQLGRGCTVSAGVRITTCVVVKDFCHLNLNVTVGHDAIIGAYSVINPSSNISGGVTLENAVQIGTGAQVLPGVTVRANAEVGAGAVVLRDVPAGTTVVGVPARPIERREARPKL